MEEVNRLKFEKMYGERKMNSEWGAELKTQTSILGGWKNAGSGSIFEIEWL